MRLYFGTKAIKAKPMTRQEYNDFRGRQLPDNGNGDDEGYLVEYHDGGKANTSEYDGYVSWSPKDVFKRAYQPNGELSFGHAVEALKSGHAVTRSGWNGKGMFLYFVPANSYTAQTEVAKAEFGGTVPYRSYIAMKTAQGDVVPWLASQSDVLENDWEVLERDTRHAGTTAHPESSTY